MKFSLVAVGKEIQSFPYLFKLSNILAELGELQYLYWDRSQTHDASAVLDGLNYKCLLKFSPTGRLTLFIGYISWFFALFWYFVTKADSKRVYFVSRLDAAAAIYLAKLLRPTFKYVYLDRDAYHMTYKLGVFKPIVKIFEGAVARRALFHFIPGESRNFTNASNIRVIQNTPNRNFFEVAKKKSASLRRDKRFTIYVNGWLVETRGANQILQSVMKLNKSKYKVIVAGPTQCEAIKDLISLDIVEYLGQLSNIDSLSYYFISDVVLTFYDPVIEINQKAEPNKWFDCIFCRTPFITNFGIETAQSFEKTGLCHIIQYNDIEALVNKLEALSAAVKLNTVKDINTDYLNVAFWDDKVRAIVLSLASDSPDNDLHEK